jgi:hypothetical protein
MTAISENLQTALSEIDALGRRLQELAQQLDAECHREPEAAISITPVGADSEVERLRCDLGDVQREYEGVLNEVSALESRRGQLKVEIATLKSEIQSHQLECGALVIEKEQLFQSAEQARQLAAQLPTLQSRQSEIDAKLAALSIREGELAHTADQNQHTREILAKLWPSWLLTGDLAVWKDQIEVGALDARAPASFGLLFAALHGYNAALRDSDAKALVDNIRDVGRRLYQWLDGQGKDPLASSEIAEIWAEAINQETSGRCSVQVAVPGNPVTNQWMTFPPRGSSLEVVTVASWCVFDAQRRPIHRAEVTV